MNKRERGQGLVEYALIISLVALSAILTLQITGVSLGSAYCKVAEAIQLKSVCAPKPLCEDSFDSLANWKTVHGKPIAASGQICMSQGVQLYNTCSMNVKQEDYVVELNNAYLYQGDGYGIFFRTTYNQKGANGYIFQYDPGLKAFVIRKWINGKEIWSPLARKDIPKDYPIYNTPHNIKIIVKGNQFSVLLDGELILQTQDDTYSEGGIGLRSWDKTEFCADQINLFSNP